MSIKCPLCHSVCTQENHQSGSFSCSTIICPQHGQIGTRDHVHGGNDWNKDLFTPSKILIDSIPTDYEAPLPYPKCMHGAPNWDYTKKNMEEIIEYWKAELDKHLELCEHKGLTYTYRSNSGNYDPSADSYWVEWHCSDCNKRWNTPQDYNYVQPNLRKYPWAKETK